MKRWDVYFYPKDQGTSGSKSFELAVWQVWVPVAVVSLVAFAAAFVSARHSSVAEQTLALQRINQELKREILSRPDTVVNGISSENLSTGKSDIDVRAAEQRIRAEYDQSIAKITAELATLYDMEKKARDITGLAPRQAPEINSEAVQIGGKGGPPSGSGSLNFSVAEQGIAPPHVIYGLARPSADLILQEIRTRNKSLQELVVDMEAEKDRIARIPSIWPVKSGKGVVTSRFGYRRDPIHGRLKHHDGTDISAAYGSPIQATARGIVTKSEYHKYYGNLIVLSHGNGLETWFAHLSKRRVNIGETVERHDTIGNLGSTGRSTGAHLHYEVHRSGKTVDAEKYLTD